MKIDEALCEMVELRKEVERLKDSVYEKEYEIELLKRQINGDRVCDSYCEKCKHGIVSISSFLGGTTYKCQLDCKCNDFLQKE